jgi:hypothetical protein
VGLPDLRTTSVIAYFTAGKGAIMDILFQDQLLRISQEARGIQMKRIEGGAPLSLWRGFLLGKSSVSSAFD